MIKSSQVLDTSSCYMGNPHPPLTPPYSQMETHNHLWLKLVVHISSHLNSSHWLRYCVSSLPVGFLSECSFCLCGGVLFILLFNTCLNWDFILLAISLQQVLIVMKSTKTHSFQLCNINGESGTYFFLIFTLKCWNDTVKILCSMLKNERRQRAV